MAVRWLLDTCVLSEVVKPVPDSGVVSWLGAHNSQSCISVVTIAELNFGVRRIVSGRRRNQLQEWVDSIGASFADKIIPTDQPVWMAFAGLKAELLGKGKGQEDLDLLIAATALVGGLTLVTRNTKHFQHTGIMLMNPWTH